MRPVDLSNQTAVVTGAGRGIGKAIALALASCRARVVLAARSENELIGVAQAITDLGGEAIIAPTDVSDESSVAGLFAQVGKRLDILVNNAGIGSFGRLIDFTTDAFDRIMAVNVRGTFLCCREALRLMLPHKSGAIINMFAGIPAPTCHEIDLDALVEKRCFLFGTSGSETEHMRMVLKKVVSGRLDTAASIDYLRC